MRAGRARMLALAGVILCTALATSGCSPFTVVNRAGTSPAEAQSKPRVGQCWTATYADVATTPVSGRTTPVQCSQPHQSYTVAVASVVGSFSGSWVGTPGHVATDVDAAAGRACVASQERLLPNLTRDAVLLHPTYKLPSVAAWERGARWVRCDVSEIETGSPIDAPRLAALPTDFATVADELQSTPNKFGYCVDDPDSARDGPTSNGAVYADCTGSPDWSRRLVATMPSDASEAYPALSAIRKYASKVCDDRFHTKTVDTFYYYPTRAEWEDHGDRSIDCWTSTVD